MALVPASAGRYASLPPAARKALVALVVTATLGMQTYVIVRPSEARFYPFVDYPMYARSSQPGKTYRTRHLRARSCGAPPRAWYVPASALGMQPYVLRDHLAAIAAERRSAAGRRALLSARVRADVTPRPCALQVWERTLTLTAGGAEPAALAVPRWTFVREWPLDGPNAPASARAPNVAEGGA